MMSPLSKKSAGIIHNMNGARKIMECAMILEIVFNDYLYLYIQRGNRRLSLFPLIKVITY